MNMLLIIVGIIFLLSVLLCYKKGLIKIVASSVATLVCFFLVTLISPSVSEWIQNSTPLKETVQEKCAEVLGMELSVNTEAMQSELSREQEISLIENAALPEILQDMLLENNNSEVYEALGVHSFVEYIGAYIAKVIADILAFLITFIVAFIAVRIVIRMLGVVDKIPLIGGANHLLGGVVGAGAGLLAIWILFIVITLLYSTSFGASCMESIAESDILTWLYDNNVLMNSITKF